MNNLVQYTEIVFRQCNGRGIKGLFLTQPLASKEKTSLPLTFQN